MLEKWAFDVDTERRRRGLKVYEVAKKAGIRVSTSQR